ncbi:MAG: hypothetical protein WA610_05805 [Thermodesulfovibrionales bacterium]
MDNIYIPIDNLRELRFKSRMKRLDRGLSLKIKEKRKRDPEKRKLLAEFFIKTTPPAEDILSGKAFRELLMK